MRMSVNVQPEVTSFYDKATNTLSYVVKDPQSRHCAVIDSVLDLDYPSGNITYTSADQIIEHIVSNQLELEWIIESHVHADHLSAAPYIQEKLGGKIGIGAQITVVQEVFGKLFNEGTKFQRDGSQFDRLFSDGDSYTIGSLEGKAIHTPGHTPACMTHVIGDAAFVGDTLFMPDGGTARADFPGGDAKTLYQSIQKILSLPLDTRIFVCHDYQPNNRELAFETSVKEQLHSNIHLKGGVSEQEFVVMREQRDSTLGMPRLIYPSLQTNMRAGHFPESEDNGEVYLKVPIRGLVKSVQNKD
ncbi:MBL fold metallo-hydrolase [Pleionea litopenaei]|uniref:MBL fold metallo-hydrolase n=1 Tax=Pleionea litopenaei TaxID=3070815 RepID=A0AA51RUQ8_9GAMM|nr:MBL fold metallo-hydrolase [Pleionea sp. HL-JVS1]WMS87859.1 MBL fold metallo-hydrolase [Pleionea sp. HL-JVS1]